MTRPMSSSAASASSTVRCSPCRKTYALESLDNPRRCPNCGGPTRTQAQDEGYRAATEASLDELRSKSLHTMRLLSYGMMTVQIITYAIPDRQLADFVEHFVMATSTISTVATELWAWTRKSLWMIIASCFIQLAAILLFFVLIGLLAEAVGGRLAFIVAAAPLAGSLLAWHHFRGYTKILRLHQGRR